LLHANNTKTSNMITKSTHFFEISVSEVFEGDVAILSRFTGKFVELKKRKTSKQLKAIHKRFKHFLCCANDFCFSHMDKAQIQELESMLTR